MHCLQWLAVVLLRCFRMASHEAKWLLDLGSLELSRCVVGHVLHSCVLQALPQWPFPRQFAKVLERVCDSGPLADLCHVRVACRASALLDRLDIFILRFRWRCIDACYGAFDCTNGRLQFHSWSLCPCQFHCVIGVVPLRLATGRPSGSLSERILSAFERYALLSDVQVPFKRRDICQGE